MPGTWKIREAVLECFRNHPGQVLDLQTIESWIASHYEGECAGVSTDVAGLVVGASRSYGYRPESQFLERVAIGRYRMSPAHAGVATTPPPQSRERAMIAPSTVPRDSVASVCVSTQPLWVSGHPIVWGTKDESLWRATLAAAIPPADAESAQQRAVDLEFVVECSTRSGQPFDLDNLCEPVFRVLATDLRYFGGRRPNIEAWRARRRVDSESGMRIAVQDVISPSIGYGETVFHDVYRGRLPKTARDTVVAEWISTGNIARPATPNPRFAVALLFGNSRANIGDPATGPTKPIIDNLYPVLGGSVGYPEDWRIEQLFVRKNCAGLDADQVVIQVTELRQE